MTASKYRGESDFVDYNELYTDVCSSATSELMKLAVRPIPTTIEFVQGNGRRIRFSLEQIVWVE